jgi:hypothetical protein
VAKKKGGALNAPPSCTHKLPENSLTSGLLAAATRQLVAHVKGCRLSVGALEVYGASFATSQYLMETGCILNADRGVPHGREQSAEAEE